MSLVIMDKTHIPVVSNLCKLFYDEYGYPEMSYSEDTVIETLTNIVDNPDGVGILYYKDGVITGMILGMKVKTLFSSNTLATEIAWYVDPLYRNSRVGPELLKAFEYWSKEIVQTDFITMMCTEENNLEKYYTRKGYTKSETAFLRKN